MTTTVLELNVSGMICRACEDAIADALLHTRGVVSAQAHYWRGRVTITYDPNIVTEDTLRQVLTNAGYPPGTHGMGGVVVDGICLALVGVLYWGLPKLLALVKVPALADNASLGTVPLLFLFGALQSFLPRGWMKYIVKGSAVLVVTLGLSMLVKGIRLFGI